MQVLERGHVCSGPAPTALSSHTLGTTRPARAAFRTPRRTEHHRRRRRHPTEALSRHPPRSVFVPAAVEPQPPRNIVPVVFVSCLVGVYMIAVAPTVTDSSREYVGQREGGPAPIISAFYRHLPPKNLADVRNGAFLPTAATAMLALRRMDGLGSSGPGVAAYRRLGLRALRCAVDIRLRATVVRLELGATTV